MSLTRITMTREDTEEMSCMDHYRAAARKRLAANRRWSTVCLRTRHRRPHPFVEIVTADGVVVERVTEDN